MNRLTGYVAAILFFVASICVANAQGVIGEWASVSPPPVPELKQIVLDPKSTAVLVMDFVQSTCTAATRPRCVAAVPNVKALIEKARAAGTFVVFTGIAGTKQFVPDIAPTPNDPLIIGHANKFDEPGLDQILKQHGISTVVLAGTSGNGAVLFTAFGAASHGYKVVVPVDTMPSESPYAEQNAVWGLQHVPGLTATTLTSVTMLSFSR